MKRHDVGDFIVFYIEPDDQRADLFQTIGAQKKPVVLIPAGQTGVLQKPDDFTLLKYVKRQADLPIIFILPHGSKQAQLAARNGFPVYQSTNALLDVLSLGQIAPSRTAHSPSPSHSKDASNITRKGASIWQEPGPREGASLSGYTPRTTKPLFFDDNSQEERASRISAPLTPMPQVFTPEEDVELPYDDTHMTSPLSTKDDAQHNTGNIWPSTPINITYRNTGPLVSRIDVGDRLDRDQTEASSIQSYPPQEISPVAAPAPAPVPYTSPVAKTPEGRFVEKEQEQAELFQTPTLDRGQTGARQGPALSDPIQTYPPLRPPVRMSSKWKGKPRLYILLCLLVLGAIGSFLVLPLILNSGGSTAQIDGHLVFTSSGQVSETSSQGIEDQVTLDLTNVAAPAPDKALYAWLLGDQNTNDPQTIPLGKLQINNGKAHIFYPGNAEHSNLLLIMSQILVTEEDTAFTPIAPSPDQSTWRYYSAFSTTPIDAPDNTKHFSFLDHLRHLLASDPTLEELELPGGLNNWLYNNTGKVQEWVDSTRQQWEETKDSNFVRRQLERALQFLDGDTFVYQDLPQGTPLLVNERLARIGLINVTGPNQEPPDYLDHISHHLNGLLESKPTPAIRQQIAALITAMGNVNRWLQQVRHDAQQLMMMTDNQMMQQSTLSIIDDMIANMDNAYSGQTDPSTNTVHEGVNWIHNQMQFLASLDITPWSGANTNNLPGKNNPNPSQPRVLIAEEKSTKR